MDQKMFLRPSEGTGIIAGGQFVHGYCELAGYSEYYF